MAVVLKTNVDSLTIASRVQDQSNASLLHPAWDRLIRYCAELGYGEIEKLKIQDGLPMLAEVTTRKIKFST
jgi:hypothetical protein